MYKAVTLAGGIREPLLTCSSYNSALSEFAQNDTESVLSCAQMAQKIWIQQFCKTVKINRE